MFCSHFGVFCKFFSSPFTTSLSKLFQFFPLFIKLLTLRIAGSLALSLLFSQLNSLRLSFLLIFEELLDRPLVPRIHHFNNMSQPVCTFLEQVHILFMLPC